MTGERGGTTAVWPSLLALRPYLLALRPYLLALLVLGLAGGLMYVGNTYLLKYGFPWVLVSLLVVALVASRWGERPAWAVLALATLFGDVVLPDLHISTFYRADLPWPIRLTRVGLFVGCGGALIWLTYQSRQVREQAGRRRAVLEVLRGMLLPDRLEAPPGYEVSAAYLPARAEEAVGGDLYDFYPISPERYGLLIGDVMGKGKEAAAHTAFLRYSVRALSPAHTPAQILAHLGALIAQQRLGFGTGSLFIGILDVPRGALTYASAGHESALLRRVNGSEEALASTGLILGVDTSLGVDAALGWQERTVQLEPGDALLLLTDGVTEARDPAGRFLDAGGAWRLLHGALCARPAKAAVSALLDSLTRYTGGRRQDDIALLLLRRAGAGPPRTPGVAPEVAGSIPGA